MWPEKYLSKGVSNIYSVGQYDTLPSYINWSFGEFSFSSLMDVRNTNFNYAYKSVLSKQSYSFVNEVDRAIKRLVADANSAKIAVCISGGLDSEIIARRLNAMGVAFELFYLRNWGLNDQNLRLFVEPLAKELRVPLNIVSLEFEYFLEEYAPEQFLLLGCHFPTYLALTYLFQNIPDNYFIVVGEGDLEKGGQAYENLYCKARSRGPVRANTVPIMMNEIVYRIWAQLNQRKGQYYFYNSTPEIVAAMWRHPNFRTSFPKYDTKGVLHCSYPELVRRKKSTNWEADIKGDRRNVIAKLWRVRSARPDLNFWNKFIGCFIDPESIFASEESPA